MPTNFRTRKPATRRQPAATISGRVPAGNRRHRNIIRPAWNAAPGLVQAFGWLLVACLAGGTSVGMAQDAADDPVLSAWAEIEATYSCRQCHYKSEPVPISRFDDPRPSPRGDFSRQDELYRWVRDDKHAISRIRIEPLDEAQIASERERIAARYAADNPAAVESWVGPSNLLSRRICDALGYDIEQPAGYQQFADACLTCHGGHNPTAGSQTTFTKPDELATAQPGISCLACHQQTEGAGADSATWRMAHAAAFFDPRNSTWRNLPPAAKAAQGMRDLVSVSNQANLCIDCHVGNPKLGMFVTHAMYAAGHPPLPNFELETFCRSMPRHWRDDREQVEAFTLAAFPGKDAYFQANFPALAPALSHPDAAKNPIAWDSRRMLVGAAAARRRAAEMIVWAAESEGLWGDYAFYDCAACHHELRRPSPRQERGYPGAPGRPRLHEWPDVLTQAIAPASSAAAAQQNLVRAVSAVPFGNPVECRDAAKDCAAALDAVAQRLESGVILRVNDLTNLLIRLAAIPPEHLIDYPTARQIVWAIQIVSGEAVSAPGLTPDQRDRLTRVQAEIAHWTDPPLTTSAGPTAARTSLVSTNDIGITTDLPAGRGRFIFAENLRAELARRADYHPAALSESLRRIQQILTRP
ncbi:MAG: hypothetical protein EA381_11140 [Planctomycetaceae bacterium]|nr:MAG: hypothetical protein EA381_11140 [Planctomycetaceae bacterium]